MPGSYFKVWSLPSYPCLRFYHTNHACLPFQSHTTTVSLSSEKQVWESLSIQSLFPVHVLAHTNQLWIRQPIKDKVDACMDGYTLHRLQVNVYIHSQDNAKMMEVPTELFRTGQRPGKAIWLTEPNTHWWAARYGNRFQHIPAALRYTPQHWQFKRLPKNHVRDVINQNLHYHSPALQFFKQMKLIAYLQRWE